MYNHITTYILPGFLNNFKLKLAMTDTDVLMPCFNYWWWRYWKKELLMQVPNIVRCALCRILIC